MTTTISTFKKYVAADVLPCPDPIVEREILSVIIDFCDKTHILTREFDVDLTELDIDTDLQNSVEILLSEYFSDNRPVTVLEFNLDGTPKIAKYRELINEVSSDIWDYIEEDETLYFSFPSNSRMLVYEIDSADSNLFIRMAVKPTRAAIAVDDFLLEDWVDVIASGVKHKILSMPGKEWTEPSAAGMYYIDYRRGISRARMKVLKSYTNRPLEVSPRLYGQIEWE